MNYKKNKESNEHIHYRNMQQFANNPKIFGMDSYSIESCIVEPVWYQYKDDDRDLYCCNNHHTLCDVIYLHTHSEATPLEVKSKHISRDKAISQIEAGYEYASELLNRDIVKGLIAYYNELQYDICHFDNRGKVHKVDKKNTLHIR